jgi:hypothetical protein
MRDKIIDHLILFVVNRENQKFAKIVYNTYGQKKRIMKIAKLCKDLFKKKQKPIVKKRILDINKSYDIQKLIDVN